MDHSNGAAEALGAGQVLDPAACPSISADNELTPGDGLTSHVIFTGVDHLAQVIQGEGRRGTRLAPNSLIQTIATNHDGMPTIGVGRIPIAGDKRGRPFVVDSSMQRFDVIRDARTGLRLQANDYTLNREGTRRYFQNLVNYLGSVGCKSDEDPVQIK